MELIQLETVDISLNNDKTVYQSGETINGTVNIALNGELDVSAVKVVLRSMAEVKWMDICGSIYYREGHVFRDSEQYLNVVYQCPQNIRETKITAGEHDLPFEFKLPDDDIPSSVETHHGFIHYWIEAIIGDESFDPDVYRNKKYFTVESPLRHNIRLAVGGGTEKEFGVLSLGSGKVRIDASLKQKGHTRGESVELHCLVTNTSSVAVTPRASLYQTQRFMAKDRHTTRFDTSEPVVGEKVKAGETRDQIISFQLPTDMPLSLKTRLISIKYFIHVTLAIQHAFDLHLNLPVIVTNEFALNDRISSFL